MADPLPLPRENPRIASGFRRIDSSRVNLGQYGVGLRRPGQVYRSPTVQPRVVDTSRLQQMESLNKSVVSGALSVKKIFDNTKDFQNEEDLKEIDRFVSGLTADEALQWYEGGQAALDAAVRQEKISGLQNPENFRRLWESVGVRAAPSLMSTITKDPKNFEAAVSGVLSEKYSAGQFLSGLVDTLTADAPEGARQGLLNSPEFQRLQGQWIEGVNREAETRMTRQIAEGATRLIAEGIRAGDTAAVQEALQGKIAGVRNTRELQEGAVRDAFMAVAEEDVDTAQSMLAAISEAEASGITIGTTDLSSETYAQFRRALSSTLETLEKKQEEDAGVLRDIEDTKVREYIAGLLNDADGSSSVIEEAYRAINESSMPPAKKLQAKQTVAQFTAEMDRYKEYQKALSEKEALQETTEFNFMVAAGAVSNEEFLKAVQAAEDRGDYQSVALMQDAWKANKQLSGDERGDIAQRIQQAASRYEIGEAMKVADGDPKVFRKDLRTGEPQFDSVAFQREYPEEAARISREILEFSAKARKAVADVPLGDDGVRPADAYGSAFEKAAQNFFGVTGAAPAETYVEKVSKEREDLRQKLYNENLVAYREITEENQEILRDFTEGFTSKEFSFATMSREEVTRYPREFRKALKELEKRREAVSELSFKDRQGRIPTRRQNIPEAEASLSDVGYTRFYSDVLQHIATVPEGEEDTEKLNETRWELWSAAVDSAENFLQAEAENYLSGKIPGRIGLVREGAFGNFRSRPPAYWTVSEQAKDTDLKAYQDVNLQILAPTAENISEGINQYNMPLPDLQGADPSTIFLLDVRQYTSWDSLLDDAKAKAHALGITPDELIEGQNKFYAAKRFTPDSPEATMFHLKDLFQ